MPKTVEAHHFGSKIVRKKLFVRQFYTCSLDELQCSMSIYCQGGEDFTFHSKTVKKK